MGVAYLCSLRSNCMKARVGAVLVKDHRIVSTGASSTVCRQFSRDIQLYFKC
jgi:dCMP deaminase